jgi:DNA-binding MarR family transcriptional regulator
MAKPSPWQIWSAQYALFASVLSEIEPRIKELGLDTKELFMLEHLEAHPNPAALARALLTPKPTITFMVKRMEAAGFLRRETRADDLRRFHLTLTPAGKKALDAAHAVLDKAFGQRLARLDATQRAALLTTLETLV